MDVLKRFAHEMKYDTIQSWAVIEHIKIYLNAQRKTEGENVKKVQGSERKKK